MHFSRAALLVALMCASCAIQASAARVMLQDCLDPNCASCDGEGWCEKCKVGYWLTTSTEEDGNQCQIEAPAPTAGQNTTMLDIDPRIQYLTDSGFCAEEALQMAALYHGAWLPQLHTRGVAGQKLLTGPDVAQALDNWGATLDTLRVDSVAFNGTGAEEYLAFAKQWLLQEVPVVVVAYIPGEEDEYWDHAETVRGITTATPEGGYDATDVFHINTVVEVTPPYVSRVASELQNTRNKCLNPLEAGGCVPANVVSGAGWAIPGMQYTGIGPRVQLKTKEAEEPTVEGEDTPADPEEWDGTAVLSGLEAGKSYTLYKFTDPAKVPDSAEAAVDAAGAAWSAAVVATGATQEVPVKFSSGTPAYYIAVAA